ncbi:putative porin [Nibricoccus sp. IMCC34717]|uniref:putative porin n=1 Tax=Nibricoccus sp. IMCC34717 TaxID=3034021 RepID=UPI00384A522E
MPPLLTSLTRRKTLLTLSACGAFATAAPMMLADDFGLSGSGTGQTQTATVALIRRMAAKGLISREEAGEMLLMAEADAAESRAQAAFAQAALAQAAAAQARNRALQAQLSRRNGGAALDEDALADIAPKPNHRIVPELEEPLLDTPIEEPPVPRQKRARRESVASQSVPTSKADLEIDALVPPQARRAKVAPTPQLSDDELAEVAPAPRAPHRIVPEVTTDQSEEEPESHQSRPLTAAASPTPREGDVAAPPQTAPESAPAAEPERPAEPGVVRVRYIPDSLRRQIKEEVKQEVMAQAREEGWATPRAYPEWTDRISLYGDIRARLEALVFPSDNAVGSGSPFFNFNSINTSSSAYDITGLANPPYVNTHESRKRVRIRARLGANADLGEGFGAGLRVATGESNSPVTQNQSLGASGSGQGGNFGKYALWLDRAFLRYEMGGLPDNNLALSVGRFENPFYATSMVWADDLGFDGFVAKGIRSMGDVVTPFFSAGAFPVFNTDLNFGTTDFVKTKSNDKWLSAAQIGTEVEVANDVNFKIAAAYYHFTNVEGKVSKPLELLTASESGDTDTSRPAFAQRGNTYIALRDIVANADNQQGTINQWQYFGLATPFHIGTATTQLDFNHFEPVQISIFGEYAKNFAFNRDAIVKNGPKRFPGPVNNNGTRVISPTKTEEYFDGSGTAWTVGVRFGHAELQKRWNWNALLAYRDVGSDALVDGFADSDFGGGGTNQKGFIVSSSLALSKRVWVTAKWMSATQKAGPTPIKSDTVQFDINGKF